MEENRNDQSSRCRLLGNGKLPEGGRIREGGGIAYG